MQPQGVEFGKMFAVAKMLGPALVVCGLFFSLSIIINFLITTTTVATRMMTMMMMMVMMIMVMVMVSNTFCHIIIKIINNIFLQHFCPVIF
jgi:hypothetical protein